MPASSTWNASIEGSAGAGIDLDLRAGPHDRAVAVEREGREVRELVLRRGEAALVAPAEEQVVGARRVASGRSTVPSRRRGGVGARGQHHGGQGERGDRSDGHGPVLPDVGVAGSDARRLRIGSRLAGYPSAVADTMRALRKTARAPGAELVEIPIPEPGDDEVLVRVHGASICGTDLHIYEWNEWADDRIGRGADDVRPRGGGHGARPWATRCTTCSRARSSPPRPTSPAATARPAGPGARTSARTCGSSASTPKARSPSTSSCPATNAWVVGEGIDPDVASIMEPFGNAVHAAFGTGGGEDIATNAVAVIGCGPIGLFAVGVVARAGRVEGDRDRAERVPAREGRGDGRRPARRPAVVDPVRASARADERRRAPRSCSR